MRFLIQVILTSLFSYLLQPVLPPWIVVFIAAMVVLITPTTPSLAFLGGFVGISVLWMVKAAHIDVHTHSILSTKVASLLGVKKPILLLLLTGLVGGILGGLGAACGQHILFILRSIKKGRNDFYKAS
jgi:hypothetical protein